MAQALRWQPHEALQTRPVAGRRRGSGRNLGPICQILAKLRRLRGAGKEFTKNLKYMDNFTGRIVSKLETLTPARNLRKFPPTPARIPANSRSIFPLTPRLPPAKFSLFTSETAMDLVAVTLLAALSLSYWRWLKRR